MHRRAILSIAASVAFSGPALAGAIDLNLHGDAASLRFAWRAAGERLDADVGWLHHEDDGDVASAGLHVADDAGSVRGTLRAGIGGRLFYIDADREDGTALGIGGFVRYALPRHERVELGLAAHYAPDVLAFGDAEEYTELSARCGYRVFEGASVYAGYRWAEAEFAGDVEAEIDSNVHVGFRIEF